MNGNRQARGRSLWLILYVRELICVALLLTASDGIADEPVNTSDFPDPSTAYFGLARAVARPDQPVRFAQLLEYQCEEEATCSGSDLFLTDGDRLVTGGVEGKRVYAWFRGRGKYLRGWLPAANVKELPFATHPASKMWDGTWTVGEVQKIIVKADSETSELMIDAYAEWHGGVNGEVTHTGGVHGKGIPDGNRLVIRNGRNAEDCVLELELVGEFLAAQDNMNCGGMNVSFSDVYIRNASAGDHAPSH
jgi:hypothetical protein